LRKGADQRGAKGVGAPAVIPRSSYRLRDNCEIAPSGLMSKAGVRSRSIIDLPETERDVCACS